LLLFFHESVPPQLQSIPLGPFQSFWKIRGDIRKSSAPPVSTTPVSMTPVANFATSFTIFIDTGGKFDKFATGVNDTGGK
jgi:hypothetical protein